MKTIFYCPMCEKECEAEEDDEKITFRCEDCNLNGIHFK